MSYACTGAPGIFQVPQLNFAERSIRERRHGAGGAIAAILWECAGTLGESIRHIP